MLPFTSFLFLTALVGLLTWLFTRKDNLASESGYFLAGRSLSFPVIAGSLLLTNLSTEQMVGLNGAAYADGLAVMVWEVLAVVALVAMALFFLPRFLRSGIATIPELLEKRFDRNTQLIGNIIFLLAYACILLPIILYTGATGMITILNLDLVLGLSYNATLWLIVWVVGIVGAIYALTGGLKAVAISGTLNAVGLLIAGPLIVYFGLAAVGDGAGAIAGWQELRESNPERFNSIGGSDTSVPFSTVFTGILLLNLFYWCTNQQIIQRTFGASSLAEGQKGVLLTGGLKLLGPIYLVIPGIIAYHMFAGENLQADMAYGRLVSTVMPPALIGFFAAVLLGAILSSFNSALNSTCTLFSLGVYRELLRPEAGDRDLIRVGVWFGVVMTLLVMSLAPLLAGTESIFAYLQKMNGIYFIPLFAVILLGFLHPHLSSFAAKVGLIGGVAIVSLGYFVPPFSNIASQVHEFHFLGIVFVGLIALMLGLSAWKPRTARWQQVDVKAVDMTPWRGAPIASAILIFLVIGIYVYFAF